MNSDRCLKRNCFWQDSNWRISDIRNDRFANNIQPAPIPKIEISDITYCWAYEPFLPRRVNITYCGLASSLLCFVLAPTNNCHNLLYVSRLIWQHKIGIWQVWFTEISNTRMTSLTCSYYHWFLLNSRLKLKREFFKPKKTVIKIGVMKI